MPTSQQKSHQRSWMEECDQIISKVIIIVQSVNCVLKDFCEQHYFHAVFLDVRINRENQNDGMTGRMAWELRDLQIVGEESQVYTRCTEKIWIVRTRRENLKERMSLGYTLSCSVNKLFRHVIRKIDSFIDLISIIFDGRGSIIS